MHADRDRLVLAALLAESVLAGGNAVAVRFSNRELDPLWGAGLRFSLASLLLLGAMVALRLAAPRGRALVAAMVYGSLNFGVAFGFAYYALVEIQAGFGQLLLAVVPLLTLLLAVAQRQERLLGAAVLGALLALAGIAIMSGARLQSVPTLSLLAAVGSALCLSQAAVLVRWFPPVHPVTMNAVGMATGALMLLGLSLLVGESIVLPDETDTWLALGYLVVVGSVLVFVLYVFVLRYWSASRAAYAWVISPVFTVLLSAWLDDEPIEAGLVLGGLLVLGGVYVGALRTTAGEAPERARRPGSQVG